MITVEQQLTANEYTEQNSINLTYRNDYFVRDNYSHGKKGPVESPFFCRK